MLYVCSLFRFMAKLKDDTEMSRIPCLSPRLTCLSHQCGTFVTTHKPTLTHHSHPKSRADTTVTPGAVGRSVGVDRCVMTRVVPAVPHPHSLPVGPSAPAPGDLHRFAFPRMSPSWNRAGRGLSRRASSARPRAFPLSRLSVAS